MNTLSAGNYLGNKVDSCVHNGIIVSKTKYSSVEYKGWHSHENSFFAYFLRGGNRERRIAKEFECSAGTLMFYHSQEAHCNTRYTNDCNILHVEIDNSWFCVNDLRVNEIKADLIGELIIKNIFVNILQEFAARDELTGLSLEHLLMYVFIALTRTSKENHGAPSWVKRFDVLIRDCITDVPTLEHISKALGIHPVTLSKDFYKYYRCSFGDHVRQLKIEKSLTLLGKKHLPLDDVAYQCGFTETSNFIRTFKKVKGLTPGVYRQLI